ncbi:MAG: hypothetical protein KC613_12290, partial [Myxococcales bacterium]|nr:hypothetical protein [Myxococcales bacterium]
VAGAYAGEPGVWLQVGYGEGDPVVRVEAPGCALEGLAIADARGDGVQVAAPKFRFAHGWIGRPRYGFGSRDERTGLRTDGAPGAAAGLTMVASWVGLAHGSSGYGVVASGPDLRFEDVTLNLSPRDGLRPQGDLLNGILLRDAPHARVIGLHEIYTQQGLVFEGDCTGARVTGSTFGLGADGLCHAFQRDDPGPAEEGPGACLDHGGLGLVVRGARGVQIGGPLPEDRNVFGDFDQDAIWVTGDSEGTLIQGNWLGLAADGTCQPSGPEGLCRLQQQSVLRVSGGVGTQILDNHTGPSPIVVDGTARDTELRGNQLGVFADDLRVTWTVFTSRYRTALRVQPGTAGTVVAGNRMSGAELAGPTAFFENRVGLDAAGAAMPEDGPALQAYPLGARGWARGLRLLDGSAGSVVHDNAIAHFADWCVAVEAADDVVFRDNQVGLSADGAQVTRCLGGGLRLWRSDRVAVTGNGFAACGAVPNARFEVACVLVGRDSEDARVADNRFGLTTAGEVAASPNPAVVLERALRPQIVGNTILGASPWGIYDRGDFFGVPPAEAARITANRVGVDPDGVIRGGAPQAGILAVGSGARIGGVDPDEGNWIAGAGGPGVWVGNVTGVQVRGNRLEANGGLGISLGGGSDPAANDPLDGDGGPNGYQNHPTLHGGLGARAVTARLASHPNQDFTVDVYAVAQPDPSGHGEADEWLGAAVVRTDAQGAGETVVALSRDVLPAEQVTAVATGAEGSSEFGPAVALGAQPEARLLAALNGPLPADVGQPADVGLYVENSGPQAAPAAVYTVTVPEGITWRTLPEPPFGDCVDEGRVLRCTLGELGPGVVWEAQAQLQGDAPGVYPVTARIESGARNLTPANGEQTQELVVGGVGFLLVARAQNFQNRFDVGQPAPLEAQIFRTGAPATVIRDLTLFVTLPVAGTLDAPCVPDGARWRCAMGDVAARQSPTYVLTARFAQPTPAGGPAQVEVLAEAANPNFEGVQRGVVFLTVVGEPLPEGLRLTLALAQEVVGERAERLALVGG